MSPASNSAWCIYVPKTYLFVLCLRASPRKRLTQTAPASNLISIISRHINQTEDPAGNYANEALIPRSSAASSCSFEEEIRSLRNFSRY